MDGETQLTEPPSLPPPPPPMQPPMPPPLPPPSSSPFMPFRLPSATTLSAFAPQSLPHSPFRRILPDSITYERRASLPLSPILASPPAGDTDGQPVSLGSTDSALNEQDTFYQRMNIEVHEPVGNLSISPYNRDVVLAARKGLFIIDLEHPYNTPRFLPQGGTWEVADVQWNPHIARSEYIVSTSSQKLLIWNLYKTGQTSIEHILSKHYRAITDINWSPFHPDVIASCGIDSWIWAWDLRQGAKTAFGVCAWDAPATQVKWNRRDEHLIASSHDDKVLIWDNRKGALPLLTISAHQGAKIYGIDWSRKYRNEIVTCSLDKTIKFWTIDALAARKEDAQSDQPQSYRDAHPDHFQLSGKRSLGVDEATSPRAVIHTRYPVWRARHLPFGYGVLGLPQRGDTALEMWTPSQPDAPIYTVEGHTDVVKEYVWRWKGGSELDHDDREFQLVTWSKDRTLRLWPIDPAVMKAAGHDPDAPIQIHISRCGGDQPPSRMTFRDPPETPPVALPKEAAVSAPLSHRVILASIQAGAVRESAKSIGISGVSKAGPGATTRGTPGSNESPERSRKGSTRTPPVQLPLPTHPAVQPASKHEPERSTETVQANGRPTATSGFMTRGSGALTRPSITGAAVWYSGVTVERRGGSGGLDSSGPASRIPSGSRASSVDARTAAGERYPGLEFAPTPFAPSQDRGRARERNDSLSRTDIGVAGSVMPEHLLDEIATITRKFGTRVQCEKVDVDKKRTCTFTLLGPWRDDHALTFIRITFSFPKDYWKIMPGDPNALRSIPSFDLDKIQSISLKTKAFLLKKLRNIRYTRRPCLEPCLRFLLGEAESGGFGYRGGFGMSEGSRSDDDVEDDEKPVDKDIAAAVGIGIGDPTKKVQATKETRGRIGNPSLPQVKNTPENSISPRRCGGVFGPNGELVCFFFANASARVVQAGAGSLRRNASPSPSIVSRAASGNVMPRPFSQATGTIAHAMRGLSKLTNDGSGLPAEPEARPKNPWQIPGLMDTFFIGPVLRSATRDSRETRASSIHSRPLSSVSIKRFSALVPLDRTLAQDYQMMLADPFTLCLTNLEVAKAHGRLDQARFWSVLYQLFCPTVKQEDPPKEVTSTISGEKAPLMEKDEPMIDPSRAQVRWGDHPLAKETANRFYDAFARQRDLQMLAMLSVILLEVDRLTPAITGQKSHFEMRKTIPLAPAIPALPVSPRITIDYFSLRPREQNPSPTTPSGSFPKLHSYASQASLSSPSRSSWASRLLSTSHDRDGSPPLSVQSKRRERTISSISTTTSNESPRGTFYSLTTPTYADTVSNRSNSIPVPPSTSRLQPFPIVEVSPKRRTPTLVSGPGSKSSEGPLSALKGWSEPSPGPSSARINVMFSPGGVKRWSVLGGGGAGPTSAVSRASVAGALAPIREKKKVISVNLQADDEEIYYYHAPFAADFEKRGYYVAHILAYAEVLYQWELMDKRAELLKYLGRVLTPEENALLREFSGVDSSKQVSLETEEKCVKCKATTSAPSETNCLECNKKPLVNCAVCRLPAEGLAHTCLRCLHVTHYKCWRQVAHARVCPTGCGCECATAGRSFESEDVPRAPDSSIPDTPASSISPGDYTTSAFESTNTSRMHSPDVSDLREFNYAGTGYNVFGWNVGR